MEGIDTVEEKNEIKRQIKDLESKIKALKIKYNSIQIHDTQNTITEFVNKLKAHYKWNDDDEIIQILQSSLKVVPRKLGHLENVLLKHNEFIYLDWTYVWYNWDNEWIVYRNHNEKEREIYERECTVVFIDEPGLYEAPTLPDKIKPMIKNKDCKPIYDLLFDFSDLTINHLNSIPRKYWVLSMLLMDDWDTLGNCDEEGFLKVDEGSEDEGGEDERSEDERSEDERSEDERSEDE